MACSQDDFSTFKQLVPEHSEETTVQTVVKRSNFQTAQWRCNSYSATLKRSIYIQTENIESRNLSEEELILKFKISWTQPEPILCKDFSLNTYIILEDPRVPYQTQSKYNLSLKYYQYNYGFGFDEMNINFQITDIQAFNQENDISLPDFEFKSMQLIKTDKKFEYELNQNGNKIHRYKCTFLFNIIFESTFNDEKIIEPIERYVWLDIIQ